MAWRLFLSSSQPCWRPGEGLQGVAAEEEFAGGVELDAFGATWTDGAADPPEGVAVAGFAAGGAMALLAADGAMTLLATVTEAACEGTAAPAAGGAGLT